ncbi:hypothetical protein QAD02_013937 [Eretmocerus hayati]|uniref:Uncharacterized protein n=1 Tax=Eretmocerus hayati TaxID=131215 RepID=A0ACC2P8Q0_9HYME|nr:hypothetical protein QAD02_013937 [Eretmocerus hayati]
MSRSTCTICLELLYDVDGRPLGITTVKEKGLNTFVENSKTVGDGKYEIWENLPGIVVHIQCRKNHSNIFRNVERELKRPRLLSPDSSAAIDAEIESNENQNDLNYLESCFICSQTLHGGPSIHQLNPSNLSNLREIAAGRKDHIGINVLQRISDMKNPETTVPKYHLHCYASFKKIPSLKANNSRTSQANKHQALDFISNYIETSENYEFTLRELQELDTDFRFSNEMLERELLNKFGDRILIDRGQGKSTRIHYKGLNLTNIYNYWWFQQKTMSDKEKRGILSIAARILREDILSKGYDVESYPPPNQFLADVVQNIPRNLNYFLTNLLDGKKKRKKLDYCNKPENTIRKQNSIVHSLISTIRPRSFSSTLQLAIGIYVYRKTGSRLIIDLLSKFGACSTYYSIQLYQASVVMNPPRRVVGNVFVQLITDNTDHDANTHDGHNTSHCLGTIIVYTLEYEVTYEGGTVRLKSMASAPILASQNTIQIRPFTGSINAEVLRSIKFRDTKTLGILDSKEFPCHYIAYILAKMLNIEGLPLWKGFLSRISEDTNNYSSDIVCCPFITQPPSNLTTLYTFICHAVETTEKLGQKMAVFTADQPLYYKLRLLVAWIQIQNHGIPPEILDRCGGFHLLMSNMGSMCHIMLGSGLEDMWCTVHAQDSMKKMLTGHAYARALRAHILSYTALNIKLCESLDLSSQIKSRITSFFANWSASCHDEESYSEEVRVGSCNIELFNNMREILLENIKSIQHNNPTAKLWIDYSDNVAVALQFVGAERTGNWRLSLQCMKRMLPILHAAGHFAYAKSLQIYLQDLVDLEVNMDATEFIKFTDEGGFSIRRSITPFSGNFADQTIECMNRFFGTDLIHGRGVDPSVLARYFAGMPAAVTIIENLEDYCGLKTVNSEQHAELSEGKVSRDNKDLQKFLFWLDNHNPFQPRNSLTSLSTGVIANANVNGHLAIKEGIKAMATMVGKTLDNITLSTANKVKPLSDAKELLHVADDTYLHVNSTLLLDRVFTILRGNTEGLRSALEYELAPWPMSIFDKEGMMRKPNKSDLYRCFESSSIQQISNVRVKYVLDGGFLLHALIWPHSTKFSDIFAINKNHINLQYGQDSTVVFDGYLADITGTKSYERYRRERKNEGADINLGGDNLLVLHQKQFLSNNANKFKFVHKLAENLQSAGSSIQIATEDADTLIVDEAIRLKQESNTPVVIVGNDVDLVVLSIARAEEEIYFLKKSSGREPEVLYSTSKNKALKSYVLFAHAFAGCDTTSALFKIGKTQIMKLLANNMELREASRVYYQPNQNQSELLRAGEKIIRALYNNKKYNLENPTISELRFRIFSSCSPNKEDLLSYLPPTQSGLQQHVNRVYYQVQAWLGNQIAPEEWGWVRTNLMLLPIMNSEPAAPENLLRQVFCNCQGDCSSSRCTCKKTGLRCSFK